MKKITVYECSDGTRFDSEAKAEKYDNLLSKLKDIESKYLGKSPNGNTYTKQHNLEDVHQYKLAICKAAAEYFPRYAKVFEECGIGTRHMSHAQYYIQDYNATALLQAFYRLECIDEKSGIEYEQPYYATHPEEWTKFEEKYLKKEQ